MSLCNTPGRCVIDLQTETSSASAAHQVLVRTEQPGTLRAGALRSKEVRFVDHKMQRIPVTPVQ